MLTNRKTPDVFHIWHLAMTIKLMTILTLISHLHTLDKELKFQNPSVFHPLIQLFFLETTQPFPYTFSILFLIVTIFKGPAKINVKASSM